MSEAATSNTTELPPPFESLGQPEMRLELLSQPRYLCGGRSMVESVALRLGFDELNAGQIALAVDEALANVIRHGYDKATDRRIWMSLWPAEPTTGKEGIHIAIEDEAKQVDPAGIKSRDVSEVRPGGLGVYLIEQIMDAARYEQRDPIGMRLMMTKFAKKNPSNDKH